MATSPGGGTDPEQALRGSVARLAAEHPGTTAVYRPDGVATSYAELQRRVGALRDLLPAGLRRVGLRIPNAVEGLVGLHAIWQHGASAVLLSPLVPESEARRRLRDSACDAFVSFEGAEVRAEALDGRPAPVAGEAAVVFTSGTTGRPKGAVLTFSGVLSSVESIGEGVGLAAGRRPSDPPRSPAPVFVPLAHVGGLLATVNAMYQGKPLVLVDRFRAAEVFDLVARFQLTLLRLAPAMVHDLAYWPDERSLRPVRSVSVGSAPLNEEAREVFEARYGAYVLQSYGLTEFSGAIAFERYEDAKAGRRRPGTVGRLAPGVKVRILDEEGVELPAGGVGEIQATGPSRFAGYLTAAGSVRPPRNGWVTTGDLGRLDEDGFLAVLGRADDTILCGGFNVYPAVVEAALNRLGRVTASAVAGVPDERLGAVPVAAVVCADGGTLDVEVARAELREDLAPYEVPRRILAVPSIPVTAGGKLDRRAVGALFSGAAP